MGVRNVLIDMTGKRYGRLTALSYSGHNIWKFRCDCGVEFEGRGDNARHGGIKSCGCLYDEFQLSKSVAMRNNLAGLRFGKLVAVDVAPKPDSIKRARGTYWLCKCDCGNEKVVRGTALTFKKTTSCGCSRSEPKKLRAVAIDLRGMRFGMLTAVATANHIPGQGAQWECHCDCGNTKYARAKDLRSGNTSSCGCRKYHGIKPIASSSARASIAC